MYFTQEHVRESLSRLKPFHPFFGMDFLVAKLGNLPIGGTKAFSFDGKVDEFLRRYYKPDPGSQHFFQPFRTTSRTKQWLSAKYPSSTSQSTRTKSDLAPAFLHEKDTDRWGWANDYVSVLRRKLERDKKGSTPAYWLAVWLFRSKGWREGTTPEIVVRNFIDEFHLTKSERDELFDLSTPAGPSGRAFTDEPYSDKELLKIIGRPPDALPEQGGILNFLGLAGVGPSRKMSFNPSERLTIVTGDNGLGKTFLLECAWWSLTGEWAERDRPLLPRLDARKSEPRITFEISAPGSASRRTPIAFDWSSQSWKVPRDRPTVPGIVVYARVDGSFAVWDPARHLQSKGPSSEPGVVFLTRDRVLDGLPKRSEGLLHDWVKWQNSSDQRTFDTFSRVVRRFSPPDADPLKPGQSIRLPGDVRDIPTLVHDYGTVPFLHESAGIRRIATIGYLLVWTWTEHNILSTQARKPPERNMVVLIDEMEAHLHPKWQRTILPALLDVVGILSHDLQAQIIVSTHSPLILASVEEYFSDETDALFHLEAKPHAEPALKELPFVRYGKVDAWLTSDLFELKQARSREGESAVERAKRVLEMSEVPASEIMATTDELKKALPPDDDFWPRWLFFVRSKGLRP
jgi:hypothetical protein